MIRLLIVACTLLLPLVAHAQGTKQPLCGKERPVFFRSTAPEAGTVVFGSVRKPPGVPGRAVADGEEIVLFGTGATCAAGDGCPDGTRSSDCWGIPDASCSTVPRQVFADATGQTDGRCVPEGPPDGTPLGPCCVCRWLR